jgi:ABC-2 type transport system ATP-binding protein
MPEWMIQTENLTKRFPSSTAGKGQGRTRSAAEDPAWFTAVDAVSLEVPAGEILALLGRNGAGKTTTVRMLAGILLPSAGRAWVAGLDTVQQARQVRQSIGLLTEFPGLYLRMRAAEYLAFFGELQGLDAATIRLRTAALSERFGLVHNLSQRLAEYSKGMRQKLALIRAMLHDPAVLLLDEPTSALDPQGAKQVRDAILDLRRERRTVMLCTHNLAEAELLADRIAIIDHGRIVALDAPERLKAELLGPPVQEVRLTHALDGSLADLADLVSIDDRGDTWFRYRTPSPETTNPEVLARLAALQARVLSLREVPRSLEEVYLRIVGSDQDGS